MPVQKLSKSHCMFCGSPAFSWTPDMLNTLGYEKAGFKRGKLPQISYSQESSKYPLCEMHTIAAINCAADFAFDPDVMDRVAFRKYCIEKISSLAKLLLNESGEDFDGDNQHQLYDAEHETGLPSTKVPYWLKSLAESPESAIDDAAKSLWLGNPVVAIIDDALMAEYVTSSIQSIAKRFHKIKGGKDTGPYRCHGLVETRPDRRCTNHVPRIGDLCGQCLRTKQKLRHDEIDKDNIGKIIAFISESL